MRKSMILAGGLAVGLGHAAMAQPAAAPAAPASALEDIVVTATRREERLQDIPVTVTAITANTLGGSGVREIRELMQVVPGLTGGRSASVMQPVIRGVGSSGVSVGDESNVATYVDGVYQADPFTTAIDLVEVERVEVLRGPQGTVFGRNATGGLINIITPDPSFETRGRISARYGRMRNDANDYDVRAYATGPISSIAAVDFAGLYRKNDGYIQDLVRGGTLGDQRVVDVRSKLMIRPDDGTKIVLTGEYANQDSTVNTFRAFNGQTSGRNYAGAIPNIGPWQASLTKVPVLDYERVNLSLRTQFDLGAVNLETTTGYMDSNAEQMSDGDSSNILLNELPFTTHVETVSQEVRLLSHSGGRLNWLVGAYAFNLAGDMDLILRNSNGPGTPVREGTLFPRVKTTSFAGFAEGTYELVPSLFVTGGVRYTTEKRKFSQTSNGVLVGQGEVEKSYNKWTYRGAIRYNFAEKANVFVSYGTGFKSGVYNAVGTSLRPTDPETIKAWEGGVKADPLSWLRTNLSIYHYNYEDLQVQARDSAGVSYILQNAANAKIYGGEFELTVSPVEDLNLRGSVAYAHGEYQDFPLAQTFVPQASGGNAVVAQDVSGKRTIRTPRATFNLGVDWAHPLAEGRLMVTANVFHSSRVYYDFLNVYSQNPYWMASGEISWSTPDERWKFSLWGKNITDAVVLQQLKPGALSTDALYEAPRRIGVGAEYRF